MAKKRETWFVYILRCANDTFYTGITKDIPKRIEAHNSGKGAKYTRTYGPCELAYYEKQPCVQDAMKREIAIKRLPRLKKQTMVDEFSLKKIEAILSAVAH